jgi:FlaA1/EpsC-like NDP-sugar epimerase
MHEQMIGAEDALHTYEYLEHYKILPAIHNWSEDPERIGAGKKVSLDFTYSSDNNLEWMDVAQLRAWIDKHRDQVGKI